MRKTFERNFVSIEVTSTMPFLLYCSITLEARCENSHLSEEKYGSNSVSKSHVIWQTVSGLLENLSPCYDATIFGSKSEVCHSELKSAEIYSKKKENIYSLQNYFFDTSLRSISKH